MKQAFVAAVVLCVAACNQPQPLNNSNNRLLVPDETNPAPAPPPPPATGPDAKTPFGEVKGAIDPKSVEAAGQVVQHYGALIEQGRWTEGWTLWTEAGAAKTFERNFRNWADVHLEIGDPGEAEGAAGSIYVNVPANFYGHLKSGRQSHLKANAVLRRVNDVPGSTEAQRRWHIERIDWKTAA